MGTESNGGFRNISISNCVIKPSQLVAPAFFGTVIGTSGISLEIVDGGTMMGITISNIQIEGTESPIFIRLGNRARPYRKGIEIKNIGVLGDISIDQVRIQNAGNTGCSITGLPGFPVHNIRLSNIYFQQAGGCGIEESRRDIPEKPADYPEATMFGALPASGFFIRHASNVTLDRVEFAVQMPDQRPSVYIDDVNQGIFTNILMQGQQSSEANFILHHTRDILVQGCTLHGKSDCFVRVLGTGNSAISIINNMVRGTATVFSAEHYEPDLITASGNIQ
jgi:polygalacturonase